MEQNQESLFGLSIDQPIRPHLSETARWANFLGILGMIFTALFVLFGIIMIAAGGNARSSFESYDPEGSALIAAGTGVFTVFYLIGALMMFFPSLFLIRFAGKMKAALAANDQAMLTASFQNLKLLFRFWGIITIIVLAFYLLMIAAFGTGFLMGSR